MARMTILCPLSIKLERDLHFCSIYIGIPNRFFILNISIIQLPKKKTGIKFLKNLTRRFQMQYWTSSMTINLTKSVDLDETASKCEIDMMVFLAFCSSHTYDLSGCITS
jgi:hypothetical protein